MLKSLPLKVASVFRCDFGGGERLYLAWMIAFQTIVEDQSLALQLITQQRRTKRRGARLAERMARVMPVGAKPADTPPD